MTVKEILDNKLGGHVKGIDALLSERGLNGLDTYTVEIGKSPAFQLAFAGGLFQIYINPNVSQGDWSRSWGNRDGLGKIIEGIYDRYAPDENPFAGSVSCVEDISDMW
jgi:hypothetical protein